jgi:signal peptidase I
VNAKERGDWRGTAIAVLLALAAAFFIRTFVVQAYKIPSESMYPTILVGDHVLVNKFIYGFRLPFIDTRVLALRAPERGDVIVFPYPPEPATDYIKRVVAVAGDVVEMRDKRLFIDGCAANEPYTVTCEPVSQYPQGRDNYGPFTVPAGMLFVMGDNRDNSRDSRFWGPVPVRAVKGKAMFVYWSADLSKPVLPWLKWPWASGDAGNAIFYRPRASRLGMAVR